MASTEKFSSILPFGDLTLPAFAIIGKVVNTQVDEKALDENGKVDVTKLNAISFDTFQFGYYALGEKVGQAWGDGTALV